MDKRPELAATEVVGDFVLDEGKERFLSLLREAVGQAPRSLTIIARARGLSRQSIRVEGRRVVDRGGRIIAMAIPPVPNHLEPSYLPSMRRRAAWKRGLADGTIWRRPL